MNVSPFTRGLARPAFLATICIAAGAAFLVLDPLLPNLALLPHLVISAAALALLGPGLWRLAKAARAGDGATERAALIASLRRERDAALAASAAKSRYLANVSHEIRSPLNAIYGYAQLLERGAGIDPQEAARVIKRSAEHLTDLVEGLLDISLIENGVMRVAQDTVRLQPFIEQVERMFRPSAASKGLGFRCEINGRLPDAVRTDQKRLRQILINLLSNAIKYTDRGEVVLSVRYAGQVAVFEVRDTGPGIAPELQETIFAPFDRGEETGTGGFGLGLPITRALVQILGGEIELVSTPGQGSCFRVRVMLGQVAGAREASAGPARAIGYEGRRRHVLVMDDDPAQLSFVRRAMEDLGFSVATAPDGATALALCHAGDFDLALLDIAMPGPSGWETASHLRATHGKDLAIVMLSANAHERHGPENMDPPHDLFLDKPVAVDALVDAIGNLLGLVWLREGGPAQAVETPAPPARATLPEAARPHVDALRQMLKIGHVRGIEAEIRKIEQAAPDARALVTSLYQCLDRFDLAALGRMVEGL